jgi:hypothetical protein
MYLEGNVVVFFLSLHVDDTLCTGTDSILEWANATLQLEFGPMKRENNSFRHYGIDVFKCMKTHHVFLDQRAYLDQLQPFTFSSKQAKTSLASAEQVTSFRSLVSGIAWAGLTSPLAQALASLYQGFLPEILVEHMVMLNKALNQLKEEYVPLVFRSDLVWNHQELRLVVLSDSSLANTKRYSQQMHVILLCHRSDCNLAGKITLLHSKSAKSKRVATSTYHAETLAHIAALEEAQYFQSWLYELFFPMSTTADLLAPPSTALIPIVAATDCHDLFAALLSPAPPTGLF